MLAGCWDTPGGRSHTVFSRSTVSGGRFCRCECGGRLLTRDREGPGSILRVCTGLSPGEPRLVFQGAVCARWGRHAASSGVYDGDYSPLAFHRPRAARWENSRAKSVVWGLRGTDGASSRTRSACGVIVLRVAYFVLRMIIAPIVHSRRHRRYAIRTTQYGLTAHRPITATSSRRRLRLPPRQPPPSPDSSERFVRPCCPGGR